MKFLVDGQLPPALARYLQSDLGAEAIHVNDVGLRNASDVEVWQYAEDLRLIVISKDEDFLSFAIRADKARLIWVRIGNCRRRALLESFRIAWPEIIRRLKDDSRFIELR